MEDHMDEGPESDVQLIKLKKLHLGTFETDDVSISFNSAESLTIGFSHKSTTEQQEQKNFTLALSDIVKLQQNYEIGSAFLKFVIRPSAGQRVAQAVPTGFKYSSTCVHAREKRFILQIPDDVNLTKLTILQNILSSITPIGIEELDEDEPVSKKRKKEPKPEPTLGTRVTRRRNNLLTTIEETNVKPAVEVIEIVDDTEVVVRKPKKVKEPQYPPEFKFFNDLDVVVTHKSGSVVYMEDYKCLDYQSMITNGIMDFYLRYIFEDVMSEEQQKKVHFYDTNFYSLLATDAHYAGWTEGENKNLTAEKKRYEKVKNLDCNRNVDIFQKDFIVIPLIDREHWFLAIVCFPSINGAFTKDGNAVAQDQAKRDKKNKDENLPPIKQSCILIFDSVPDGSGRRAKAVRFIKGFLEQAHLENHQQDFAFEVGNVVYGKVNCPKQKGSVDCGLFVMEFIEHFFFKSAITDFRPPIELSDWFSSQIVLKKREELSCLIKKLIVTYGGVLPDLPPVRLFKPPPVLNVENNNDENAVDQMEVDEDTKTAKDPLDTGDCAAESDVHDGNHVDKLVVDGGELEVHDEENCVSGNVDDVFAELVTEEEENCVAMTCEASHDANKTEEKEGTTTNGDCDHQENAVVILIDDDDDD